MNYYKAEKYIADKIIDAKDMLAIYLFGNTHDENGDHWFDYYSCELREYADTIGGLVGEIMLNKQFEITTENLLFLIDLQACGYTCNPHPHANKDEVVRFVEDIIEEINM